MATPLPKLAAPARRALAGAGLATLEDVARRGQRAIMDLHGMGPNALGTLQAAMREAGLTFRDQR